MFGYRLSFLDFWGLFGGFVVEFGKVKAFAVGVGSVLTAFIEFADLLGGEFGVLREVDVVFKTVSI